MEESEFDYLKKLMRYAR